MDSVRIANISHQHDSTLTESWNVIDPRELELSEPSDGESIEVIEEDVPEQQHVIRQLPVPQPSEDYGPDATDNSEGEEYDYEGEEYDYEGEEYDYEGEEYDYEGEEYDYEGEEYDYEDEEIDDNSSISSLSSSFSPKSMRFVEFELRVNYKLNNEPSCCWKISNIFILLVAIIIAGQMSLFLYGTANELYRVVVALKKELGSYKDAGVTDEIIPQDLTYQSIKPDNYVNIQDLVNIFLSKFQTTNDHEELEKFQHLHSLKTLESMLSLLMDDKEMTSPTLNVLRNISKHVDFLNSEIFDKDIKEFGRLWREKLIVMNKNMIEYIKKMKLKIIRHIDKALRKTKRRFFKNMCNLEYMKQPECYERFITSYMDFIESLPHYDINEIPVKPSLGEHMLDLDTFPSLVDEELENMGVAIIKDKDNSTNNEEAEVNENEDKLGDREEKNEAVNGNDKTKPMKIVKHSIIKNSNVVHEEKSYYNKQNQKNKKRSKVNDKKTQRSNEYNREDYVKHSRTLVKDRMPKGMESDLLRHQNLGKTNSFSYFSEGEFDEKMPNSKETYKEKEDKDYVQDDMIQQAGSSWFLRLGNHRSQLRYHRSRSDWLFDRARFRQPWN